MLARAKTQQLLLKSTLTINF